MNKLSLFLSVCCLLLVTNIQAQGILKSQILAGGKSYTYFEMKPATPVKGILILLPAAGEKPKSIFIKTSLPKEMAAYGFTTLTLDVPAQMFADNQCIGELDELIKIKLTQYQLTHHNVVIGGLSDGGAIALSYTEYLNSQATPIKLKAVFGIDPPTDLTRIYASADKEISYNCPLIASEGKSVKAYLAHTLGGSPATNPKAYEQLAIYSASAPDGGNARFLKDIPVRLYSEPDLEYVQKTYCAQLQFSNLNAFDLEKLAFNLKQAGNQQSAYITTQGKGFHSWNILDAGDFAKWITGL
ncbi:hypothetical protein [Mucilaginibacter sp. FT3.2]|uniref:hypothetical protein n=1 Tax=Mucilaginibacter sp. FT3.2 TaxID=2723090 RepID=UPI00160D623F|nr:hypothetical protein [Mucilaginibacter sp. FT3.2]MBB6233351.1 hypothetical protein [Mucilaginibacter sp. FT3.2]